MREGWVIDDRIDLTKILEDEEWHLSSVIAALKLAGLTQEDAEAFAAFAFADKAESRDADLELSVVQDRRLEFR